MMVKTWKSTWKVHGGSWNHMRPSMQCMSAFLGGCPALMLRVASQWATPVDLEISSQIGICWLFASEYHCLHLCITLIPGEYRINCISLLIRSILRYSGYYIGEAVPSAESYKGDMWLWLVSLKPMSQLPRALQYLRALAFMRLTVFAL